MHGANDNKEHRAAHDQNLGIEEAFGVIRVVLIHAVFQTAQGRENMGSSYISCYC